MSKSIRIRTTPNGSDKYVKVDLNQNFDFIEILSLKITQEEAYRDFCSDYGVIVGRVIVNSGFGVPNAKVSVFIPIDDIDKQNPTIKGLYPYELVTDKNSDGVRYNLLPKNSETNNNCFTPIGTFPNKREVLDNPELEYIYCKYYKFTTTTNESGDFMIFGVPLGNHIVHVDADISDIGVVSQRPYDLINQGVPEKTFESSTKFKGGTNLDKLVQVKTFNTSVNVQPFWGDTENCQIGISRLDFDLNTTITPSAIFMGSLFGDSEKNSINKRCRPRKNIGNLCEQVTSTGTIEMIRETITGNIESFDVQGGRVIDEDGTWSYQVPMNLDYVTTNEFGELIPSNNPDIGIPTRANVRFKVSMDETGGEGRLRTRASYLVPHNPNNSNEIDYEFGSKTQKSSLRSMYWNKIYTVSNFIPRYQSSTTSPFTAIKKVDECSGDKTPFPFNKIITQGNPLFSIIAIILELEIFVMYILNAIVITVLNFVMFILNTILFVIGNIIWGIGQVLGWFGVDECDFCLPQMIDSNKYSCCDQEKMKEILPYIPCIFVKCSQTDQNEFYAPGCFKVGNYSCGLNTLGAGCGLKKAKDIAEENNGPSIFYYPNDEAGHSAAPFNPVGLDKCVLLKLSEGMNVYDMDFYNDWVNGSLYVFLLKYKKKKKGREKFCEYECEDGNFTPDNTHGNSCHTNYLYDSCFDGCLIGDAADCESSTQINEGLIKKIEYYSDGIKVDEELFYSPITHNGNVNKKLFATELVHLGSIFDCDWQGVPKLQQYLIPTTYNFPPLTAEYIADGSTIVEATGACGLGGNLDGLLFEISIAGISSNYKQCLNIRHICEFGVNIDELIIENNGTTKAADGIIGKDEINDNGGLFFRNMFYALNRVKNVSTINLSQNYDTNFNLNNDGTYDFTSTSYNGNEYISFRGINNANSYSQPKHSYYFYFGIVPGKSALDKLNNQYFNVCKSEVKPEFNIITKTTTANFTTNLGNLTYNLVSGTAPFSCSITSTNGVSINDTFTSNSDVKTHDLAPDSYKIVCVDINGNGAEENVIIYPPVSLYGTASVSKNSTTNISADGKITINTVGGGSGSYFYQLFNSSGNSIFGQPKPFTSAPLVLPEQTSNIGGLLPDSTGYKLIITDGASTPVVINNLIITGKPVLGCNITDVNNVKCFGLKTGSFKININGGTAPYQVKVTGPLNYLNEQTIYTNVLNIDTISAGQYNVTIIDANNDTTTQTVVMTHLNPNLVITKASPDITLNQCDTDFYNIPFIVNSGSYNNQVFVAFSIDGGAYSYTTLPFVNSSTPVYLSVSKGVLTTNVKIKIVSNIPSGTNQPDCVSTALIWDKTEFNLPAVKLTIDENGINNHSQIFPNMVKFKFNISHLSAGITNRFPYTVNYSIKSHYIGNQTITTNHVETITSLVANPVTILQNVVKMNGISATSVDLAITVTDKYNCTSPTLYINNISI